MQSKKTSLYVIFSFDNFTKKKPKIKVYTFQSSSDFKILYFYSLRFSLQMLIPDTCPFLQGYKTKITGIGYFSLSILGYIRLCCYNKNKWKQKHQNLRCWIHESHSFSSHGINMDLERVFYLTGSQRDPDWYKTHRNTHFHTHQDRIKKEMRQVHIVSLPVQKWCPLQYSNFNGQCKSYSHASFERNDAQYA